MKKSAILEKGLPETGKIVRAIMKEQRVTHRALAKKLGWNTTTITMMLKRRIWTIAELLEVGKALNHDLLKYFYPVPPEPMLPKTELEAALKENENLKAEIKTKDEELLKLRTENNVLREVMKTGR